MTSVNVAKDFTRFPSGRFKRNGDTSGEAFRELFLEKQLQAGERVKIELDGTIGYSSSFLEEAFGGVVRKLRISPDQLKNQLELSSSDSLLLDEINGYISDAWARLS